MKQRTNVTIQPILIEKAKAYGINISKLIEDLLVKELMKVEPFKLEEEKKEDVNVCNHCKEHKGFKKLKAICNYFYQINPKIVVCEDCLNNQWKDTDKSFRDYLMQDTSYNIVSTESIIRKRAEERIKREINESVKSE